MTESLPPDEEYSPMSDFMNRFSELAQEAKANGVASIVILQFEDRFEDTETHNSLRTGCGPVLALGMIEAAKLMILNPDEDDT